MDDALIKLYRSRLINRADVLSRCVDADEVSRVIGEPPQPVYAGR
jgi:hypothetical protein